MELPEYCGKHLNAEGSLPMNIFLNVPSYLMKATRLPWSPNQYWPLKLLYYLKVLRRWKIEN